MTTAVVGTPLAQRVTMHESILMPPRPTSARLARTAVEVWLQASSRPYPRDLVVVLTGELVMRALATARRDLTLSFTERGGRVHVEIQADAPTCGLSAVRDAPTPGVTPLARRGCVVGEVMWFEVTSVSRAVATTASLVGQLRSLRPGRVPARPHRGALAVEGSPEH